MIFQTLVRTGLLGLAGLPLLACGAASMPVRAAAPAPAATATAAPDPSPTPEMRPTPVAAPTPEPAALPPPPPPPQFLSVGFSGLAAGSYPVHLHRICNGGQGFHLAYLPNLQVSGAGTGAIAVPAADFGQGWCVVVYANRAATLVAAYRPI